MNSTGWCLCLLMAPPLMPGNVWGNCLCWESQDLRQWPRGTKPGPLAMPKCGQVLEGWFGQQPSSSRGLMPQGVWITCSSQNELPQA